MVRHNNIETRTVGTKPKKARLVGEASAYKPLLERERLKNPNEGVDYFKKTD